MPYIALCFDTTERDAQQIRKAELQPHLDYVASVGAQLLVAGPLQLNGSEHYNGSVFIYDVATETAARELLQGDPYYAARLYASVTLSEFAPARGRWLGSPAPT